MSTKTQPKGGSRLASLPLNLPASQCRSCKGYASWAPLPLPSQTGRPEALALGNPCGCSLPPPGRYVQAALCRVVPCCAPLRWAAILAVSKGRPPAGTAKNLIAVTLSTRETCGRPSGKHRHISTRSLRIREKSHGQRGKDERKTRTQTKSEQNNERVSRMIG